MKEVSYRTALRLISKAGGQIMSAIFVKEDGSIREMTFRRNVASGVKSNVTNEKNDPRKRLKRGSVITVVEMDGTQERKWKSINLRNLKELRVNKERYIVNGTAGSENS